MKFIDKVFIEKVGLSENVSVTNEETIESLNNEFSEENLDYIPTKIEISSRKEELIVDDVFLKKLKRAWHGSGMQTLPS